MSVKFPDKEEDFNNEFDAAVKGGYHYIVSTFVFETLISKCLVYLNSRHYDL